MQGENFVMKQNYNLLPRRNSFEIPSYSLRLRNHRFSNVNINKFSAQ